MSESKFTPGPWEYVPSTEHHGPYITTGADMTYGDIADFYVMSKPESWSVRNGGDSKPIHHQHERADANARLAASAPELLEALRELNRLSLVIMSAVNFADQSNLTFVSQAIKAARAAIAKATGQ